MSWDLKYHLCFLIRWQMNLNPVPFIAFLLSTQLRVNPAEINVYCFLSQNILLCWYNSLGAELICRPYQIGHLTLWDWLLEAQYMGVWSFFGLYYWWQGSKTCEESFDSQKAHTGYNHTDLVWNCSCLGLFGCLLPAKTGIPSWMVPREWEPSLGSSPELAGTAPRG